MEPRFAWTFSNVRIHTDGNAVEAARLLGARALTVGQEIFFGAGEYHPTSAHGRSLIAHELAHIVQNRGRAQRAAQTVAVEPAGSQAEVEARRAGTLAGLGLPSGPVTSTHTGVALTPTGDKVLPLVSYSLTDWEVTAADEKQVLDLLRADPDVSATVLDLNKAGVLGSLLERIDEPANRRDLLHMLGARLSASARTVIEPLIQELDTATGKQESSQLQYNLGRLGVNSGAAAFDKSKYKDLISSDPMAPFTGEGATGVNPSERDNIDMLKAGTKVFDEHINPVGGLPGYLGGLTAADRKRQVELLVQQPISTNYKESYAGVLPSRLQVIRAAAAAHRLEPALVTAIIMAEQRDQSLVEDARDFNVGMMHKNTSIGLGQVVVSTARSNDLFSDLLSNYDTTYATARSKLTHERIVWLLASDEFNIAAVSKYIRILADLGATKSMSALPNTQAQFPGINLAAYANDSSSWPEDNAGALGMYYTSKAWTDDVRSAGWGRFVQQAFKDAKSSGLF